MQDTKEKTSVVIHYPDGPRNCHEGEQRDEMSDKPNHKGDEKMRETLERIVCNKGELILVWHIKYFVEEVRANAETKEEEKIEHTTSEKYQREVITLPYTLIEDITEAQAKGFA